MAISVQTILYLNYFVLAVFTSGLSVAILQLIVNYGIDAEVAGSLMAFKSFFVLIPSLGSSYVLKLGYKKSMLFGYPLYAVTLTTLAGKENDTRIQKLYKLLRDDKVKKFIAEKYQGAVIPIP